MCLKFIGTLQILGMLDSCILIFWNIDGFDPRSFQRPMRTDGILWKWIFFLQVLIVLEQYEHFVHKEIQFVSLPTASKLK
jgi:hypothetical protein